MRAGVHGFWPALRDDAPAGDPPSAPSLGHPVSTSVLFGAPPEPAIAPRDTGAPDAAAPRTDPGAAESVAATAGVSRAVIHALRTRRRRSRLSGLIYVAVMVAVFLGAAALGLGEPWFAAIGLGYLSGKLFLAMRYRPFDDPVPAGRTVSVVVPLYNEDPEVFRRCLGSILAQSWRPSEIWVLDDGSESSACIDLAWVMLADVPGAQVVRFDENRGKRQVQAMAFSRTQAEIVCTVDSDTVLDPDALREGLRPFADERITAVTGNVRVENSRVNVLTKLTTLRYANAFLWERAAYSTLGSVVCCCGSLSFWRRDLIDEHLDDYLGQTFLGVEVPYGDDRRLTNYALLAGRTVLQETAIAATAVPERLGHYLRQQIRWNKSFFRESLWAIRHFSRLRAIWALTVAEIGLWIACAASVFWVHAFRPAMHGEIALFALFFMAMLSLARSVRFLDSECDVRPRSQWGIFFMAPLYSLLSTFVLVPLRLVSLATLTSSAWGTRSQVEVALAPGGVRTEVPVCPMAVRSASRVPVTRVRPPVVFEPPQARTERILGGLATTQALSRVLV